MQRVIHAFIRGHIDEFLSVWQKPDAMFERRESDTDLLLIFKENQIAAFDELEQLVAEQQIDVRISPSFHAHSFTDAELDVADLLGISTPCQDILEVVEPFPIRERILQQPPIESLKIVAHGAITGMYLMTCTNLQLFHHHLVDQLRQRGAVSGAIFTPCSIEVRNKYTQVHERTEQWFWVSSAVDLGEPITERRFVLGFPRHVWGGQDFCMSHRYGPEQIFVSHRVFTILRNLPESARGSMEFEPIDLL